MHDELLAQAKLADLERDLERSTRLNAALTELYGPCKCPPRTARTADACARHAVAPGLFRRLVWAGLGG